jgi:hypothetical protein
MKENIWNDYKLNSEGLVQCRDGTQEPPKNCCLCETCRKHPNGPLYAEERYSLGIYAGKYCDEGWKKSGYRDEGPEGFDPSYAGECYEDDY